MHSALIPIITNNMVIKILFLGEGTKEFTDRRVELTEIETLIDEPFRGLLSWLLMISEKLPSL